MIYVRYHVDAGLEEVNKTANDILAVICKFDTHGYSSSVIHISRVI